MAECELTERCVFFFHDKMGKMPTTANLMKKTYCQGKNAECARFIVYKVHGGEKIPADLYPSDFDRATKMTILSSNK